MLNLLQKLHAIAVSDAVTIWHYPASHEDKKFVYWTAKEYADGHKGHWYATLEALIEAAYAVIDPLARPMPAFRDPAAGALVNDFPLGDLHWDQQEHRWLVFVGHDPMNPHAYVFATSGSLGRDRWNYHTFPTTHFDRERYIRKVDMPGDMICSNWPSDAAIAALIRPRTAD